MLILLLLLALLYCYLTYKAAVYALPCVVGWSVGHYAHYTGAGGIGAFIAGIGAALLFYMLARVVFTVATISPVRWALALAYVTPSLLLTYNAAIDLLRSNVPSQIWLHFLAAGIACIAGVVSLMRLVGRDSEGSG